MGRKAKQLPDKICSVCGSTFNRKRFPSGLEDVTRYLSRQTCSQSCGNTKDQPTDRTTFHLRARKWLKESCDTCHSTENLDAHHKDGNIENNCEENIQTLCHSCHMRLHLQQNPSHFSGKPK